jgi:septum formation protein
MAVEFNVLKGKKLLLASASPRRKELLNSLDLPVEQAHLKDVDETYPASLAAEEVAPYLSKLKAGAYRTELAADEILVTADTVVVCGNEVLGKPATEAEATQMLAKLSGRCHKVVTGVTLVSCNNSVTFSEVTEVEFATLTPDEINHYVSKYRPLDKAGAYGIQEWIGYIGIVGIHGDYYNVMGLPLHSFYRHLLALTSR